jgi:YD repeat-containing protein
LEEPQILATPALPANAPYSHNARIVVRMKDLRIEITDEGTALYLAIDPDGRWAKTTRPDERITVDWDRQGRVIGIEAIGAPARQAITALLSALSDYAAEDPEAVSQALEALRDPREQTDSRGARTPSIRSSEEASV